MPGNLESLLRVLVSSLRKLLSAVNRNLRMVYHRALGKLQGRQGINVTASQREEIEKVAATVVSSMAAESPWQSGGSFRR